MYQKGLKIVYFFCLKQPSFIDRVDFSHGGCMRLWQVWIGWRQNLKRIGVKYLPWFLFPINIRVNLFLPRRVSAGLPKDCPPSCEATHCHQVLVRQHIATMELFATLLLLTFLLVCLSGSIRHINSKDISGQGGRSWQPFGEGKNGHEEIRQTRI